MRHLTALVAGLLVVALTTPTVLAFCGFYVAKADARLFNQASQVVLVRHDDKTVITMANDFKGDPKEFAIVVPVPTVLEKGQIRISDRKLIEHLDAYTAPRLVEYFDDDPCVARAPAAAPTAQSLALRKELAAADRARANGVTIEARYTVGEYDILLLSARESGGLETWLRDNGYRLPSGASAVLGSYIKQHMKFFVARVNLTEQARLGFSYLRPLQMAFESPKFMLPIRLGTLNADGHQDLFVYALTRNGRVETTNYRTVRLPTGMELPVYVKDSAVLPRDVRAPGAARSRCRPSSSGSWACSGSPCLSRTSDSIGASRQSPPTCSSRGSTCGTTPRISPKTSCSRKPRTGQFPGTLRAATSVEGRSALRRRRALPRVAAGARRHGGRDARVVDRLAARRDSPQDRPGLRRRPAPLVGKIVRRVTIRPSVSPAPGGGPPATRGMV